MGRAEILARMAEHRGSAILRTAHTEAVAPAMEAAVEGGFRVIEFTLNTPGALRHLERFAQRPELLVGAGTVLSVDDARAAGDAGARFIVSPVADPEVIEWCGQNDLVSVPGTHTPGEMFTAHRAGADLVKLFPAPADGPGYVRTCLGPMPFLKIFPTSGVTEDNAGQFLEAGAFGVGFVACLFPEADLAAGRFDAVRDRAARMVAAVRQQ